MPNPLNAEIANKLAGILADKLIEQAGSNPEDLIDEDGEFSKSYAVCAVENLLEELTEQLFNHPMLQRVTDEMRTAAEEQARDLMEYHVAMNGTMADRLRFVGMSQADFV